MEPRTRKKERHRSPKEAKPVTVTLSLIPTKNGSFTFFLRLEANVYPFEFRSERSTMTSWNIKTPGQFQYSQLVEADRFHLLVLQCIRTKCSDETVNGKPKLSSLQLYDYPYDPRRHFPHNMHVRMFRLIAQHILLGKTLKSALCHQNRWKWLLSKWMKLSAIHSI